ncbi:MAG: SMC-Scp complex subunit ScpB [Rhodopseudomonas palustris]|nr:SMC-Scp complex subunit ScpB [Rhodopseudomonas palustris]
METLSVIAFRQPVGKPDIEAIRGVNRDGVIRTLLETETDHAVRPRRRTRARPPVQDDARVSPVFRGERDFRPAETEGAGGTVQGERGSAEPARRTCPMPGEAPEGPASRRGVPAEASGGETGPAEADGRKPSPADPESAMRSRGPAIPAPESGSSEESRFRTRPSGRPGAMNHPERPSQAIRRRCAHVCGRRRMQLNKYLALCGVASRRKANDR